MFPISHTIFLLLKVVLAFFILYVFLPSRFIKFDEDGNDWTDKIFISMVHSNFIIIVLVHLLVLFKIYETLSTVVSIIIIIIIYLKIRSRNVLKDKERMDRTLLSKLLDWSDGRLGLMGIIVHYLKDFYKSLLIETKNFLIHFFVHPFDGILLFAVLAFGAVSRFSHSFRFLHYGASDCYVHLTWTKYLGTNQIYRDGVYPYGYEAILSAVQKLFYIDPVVIIRFIGAIGGCMIIFSIYYFLRKNLKNQYILIFVAVTAYVIGTELPNNANNIWRQMSALPQEYATIFLLPGIHFLSLYFKTDKKTYLFLAAEVLAVTIFIHFYVAIFVVMGYVLLTLMYINKIFKPKTLFPYAISMISASFIAILPIISALAVGMKFHALSLGFVAESATINNKLDWKVEMFNYIETSNTLKLLILFSLIIIGYAIIRLVFKKSAEYVFKIKLFLPIAMLSLFLYTQVRSPDVGYPSIMEFSRASTFLGVVAVVLFSVTIYLIEFVKVHKLIRYIAKIAVGFLIITTVFQTYNFKYLFPVGAKLEYDEAAYAYYRIKDEFPLLNWTIISPVEQYEQSLGYGWHYNLWEFVSDTQIKPKDKLEFPTDYVFIIVEKIPLNQADPYTLMKPITIEDANQPFPDVGYAYDKFYTNYKNRRIIQAKAYFWVEDYIKRNGKFTVFMENDILKIYMLKQDGTKPINLLK